jgi:hypothetical protein
MTERRRWAQLGELWLLLAEVAVGLASLAAPSYLTLPYTLLAVAVVAAWSFRWAVSVQWHLRYETRMPPYARRSHPLTPLCSHGRSACWPHSAQKIIMGYGLVHTTLVYVFQLAPVAEGVAPTTAQALGLYAYYAGADDWVAPPWPAYFLLPAILATVITVCARSRRPSHEVAVRSQVHLAGATRRRQLRLHQRACNNSDELTLPGETNRRERRSVTTAGLPCPARA